MTDPKQSKAEPGDPKNGTQAEGPAEIRPADRWLSVHQRSCWLIVAGIAVGGAAAIMLLAPSNINTFCAAGLAVALFLFYRWCAGAPVRVLKYVYDGVLRVPPDQDKDARTLETLAAMESRLPAMMKKELAYPLTCSRAALLARLKRREEALALLRSFDKAWDASQREQIDKMIQKISGAETAASGKEGD